MPTSHASFFDVDAVATSQRVSFASVSGRLYRVEYRDGLKNATGWLTLSNDVAGTGAELTIADPTTTTQRYYRIKVRLGP